MSIKDNNLFYEYYDIIYRDKDYKKEVDLVFHIAKKFGVKPKKMLEIGCGTGNHSLFLAKKVDTLISLDIDPQMVKRAKDKIRKASIPNVTILETPIEQLKEKEFDVSVALFNVITYIPTYSALIKFMSAVSYCLRPSGLFIFDCWNGIAAMRSLPRIKTKKIKSHGKTMFCHIRPKNDLLHQTTTLRYTITVFDGKVRTKDSYTLTQTLWTPVEIAYAVDQANMKILLCSPLMDSKRSASVTDWKLQFVVQKTN